MNQFDPQGLRQRLDEHAKHIEQLQRSTIKNNIEFTQLQGAVHELARHFREASFIYIASPYTHDSALVVEERYRQVMWYTVGLLAKRQWCYSPIVHCHELAKRFSLPTNAEHWMNYNFAMLSAARELHVLCLPGWERSVGVTAEIAFWRQSRERPVAFVEPDKVTVAGQEE